MNKSDLIKLMGLNETKIDYAIPQSLFDLMNQNNLSPELIAYSYEKKSYGAPINLGEEFLYKLQETNIKIKDLAEILNRNKEISNIEVNLLDFIKWLAYKNIIKMGE
jgi:hypothetical protein